MDAIAQNKSFGGMQFVYRHTSEVCRCPMTFALYTPPQAADGPVPVVWWLSGLTCTEENFRVKAGAQAYAAQHGVMVVAPDTSPRESDHPGEHEAYDFGSAAGFYLDATEAPWSENYRMYSYITSELPNLVFKNVPAADASRQAIMGHSMGGHGALTIALKNPDRFRSVSAFAPIVAPSQVPWGEKAFTGYLSADRASWSEYDATALVQAGHRVSGTILIDQGTGDDFLEEQLRPQIFEDACKAAGQPLTLRMQEGYDHSYFFIASFMGDHMAHHAAAFAA